MTESKGKPCRFKEKKIDLSKKKGKSNLTKLVEMIQSTRLQDNKHKN